MRSVYYFCMYYLFCLVFINETGLLGSQVYAGAAVAGILVFLLSSLWLTRGFQLWVSLIMLAAGHGIFFAYGLGVDVWLPAMTKGIGMPVLFVVIPLISMPIKYGKYLEAIEQFVMARQNTPGRLFSFLAVMHLAFAIALNIGSVPTMQKLLSRSGLPTRYLTQLYTTGYASYMVFSPYDPVVNMVLLLTGIGYSSYFAGGLLMVCTLVLVSTALLKMNSGLLGEMAAARSGGGTPAGVSSADVRENCENRENPDIRENLENLENHGNHGNLGNLWDFGSRVNRDTHSGVDSHDGVSPIIGKGVSERKVYELFAHILLLIALAFAGDRFLPFSSMLYGIAVIIVVYSLVWGGLLGVLPKFRAELKGYSANLYGFRTFLPFLISATFLGTVFSHTPLRDSIAEHLLFLNTLPLYVVLLSMLVLSILLALCGVHMLITVAALAFTVSPEVIGLSAPAFALTLLSCWFVAMATSPLVPFAVIVGDTVGATPAEVTFRHNLKFVGCMLCLAPVVIMGVNALNRMW